MEYVRECWWNDDNHENNHKYHGVVNLIQLLPIEMLTLCDQQAMFNPTLVFEHPRWHSLSHNKNLTIDVILKHVKKNWNWYMISMHNSISIDHIRDHPELQWNYYNMSSNPNLTMNFVSENLDKHWDWAKLLENKAFTMNDMELLEKYASKNKVAWRHSNIFRNSNVTMNYINKRVKYFIPSDVFYLSRNKAITMDDIQNNSFVPWDYQSVSLNPNLTIAFILKNLHLNWNWDWISQNKAITMNDVQNNPKLPWNYRYLSRNINLTIDFILQNLDNTNKLNISWNWSKISQNKGIYLDDICNNPQLPWDYVALFYNPNIIMEYVLTDLNKHIRV